MSIKIQCVYKGKWKTQTFYVVTSEGPTILGLPSLRDLGLVTLHCDIQKAPALINSIKDLYPDQFDCTGKFTGEYHIVLQPDNHPVIHTCRKCSTHMKDEVKTELDDMVKHGISRRVNEPTV